MRNFTESLDTEALMRFAKIMSDFVCLKFVCLFVCLVSNLVSGLSIRVDK